MRRLLIVAAIAALGVLGLSGTAGANNASPCGASHGAFANVNGNFGWLGDEGGTPGYHNGARGQQPGATGYNNSHSTCND